jgi:hypothetical protein
MTRALFIIHELQVYVNDRTFSVFRNETKFFHSITVHTSQAARYNYVFFFYKLTESTTFTILLM